jgi:hypothetical protein
LSDVAVIVAVVLVAMPVVVIAKLAVVAPAGTVTMAGTVADKLLLSKFTATPPAGAACDRVTVPVLVPPLTTDVGLTVNPSNGSVPLWVPTAYK